jgi:tetratricopeptide (TPR) repeat protein
MLADASNRDCLRAAQESARQSCAPVVVFRSVGTYTLRDAARILRVSPARLRYWERTDLVQIQSDVEDRDPYEFRDLVCVRGILSLLEQGVPLRRIRRNVELLRDRVPEIDDPIRSLRLWVEGSERVVVRHDGVLLEPDGQMVLDFGQQEVAADGPVPAISAASEVELSPEEEAEACFVRGCQLDGDAATFDQAIECYMQAIALKPSFADCHCNLGAVHYTRGDRAIARRCFERCLEIDAQHVEANFNLANLMEEEGADEKALHHYRVALSADPLYPDLHINLALLCEKLGRRGQALRHWRRYLQLDAQGAWADVARRKLEGTD